jgi:integrase
MARKAKPVIKRERRKPGTGGIRERKGREKPFEAYYPISGGQPRYEAFYTEDEAVAWLDGLAEEQRKGTRNLAGGSMLVDAYLPMWLDLRTGHVAPRTWAGYQYYCEYACGEGGIGRLRIDQVTPLLAQQMINRLAADGFKNTAQLKAVLYQAFEYAFDPLEYIRKNPFAKVSIPTIEHKETAALTKAERARMLLEATSDDLRPLSRQTEPPPPLCPFWHLTSRLACRRGEALAIRWNNVDLENATITISTTRGRLRGAHIEGKTKTKKARLAPLPADVVELLKSHKAAQMRAALANGWRWSEQGYVFVNPATGAPLSVDLIAHRWRRLRAASGVNPAVTVHGLRHTALSILELDGVPESVRMELGGHATTAMARHYAKHATLEDVRKAVG